MSKQSNDIKKITPAEELKALLSEDLKAKKKMQKIFSLIDKSANIDDTKFNQELSKVKKLAYEKGLRIDYNPQEGFRDLSVVTTLGNKLNENKYKSISLEEIRNTIETAPDKKPSYYKQDEQAKGAVTNHETVDRHSDETFLSSSNINKAKELLKTQPTKGILKKEADSLESPKPKKTVSFGDENGLKINVREIKSKIPLNTKIDYDTLKLGNEKAHATNLEHKLERFVTVFNVGGLRQEIENMVVQYTIAQKNDNVIKNTAAALAKWNAAKDTTLTDVYDQVKTKKDNDVKEDIPIYRESIKNNLKEKGASKIVIKDVLNEFDQSIKQPINSANNKDSIALLASQGFQKFGDIIGAPPRIDDRTARIKKINQEAEKVQDTPQPKAENNIRSRISELQTENQKIDAELHGIAASKAEKRFGRFNIPLIRKKRNLKKEQLQNNNLIQGYEKIVQPTLSILARKAQKMFAEVQSDKSLKSTLEKEKMSDLIQNKINKIKETSVNSETQTLINDLVKAPEAPQKTQFKPIEQRRPLPARKFPNKGQEENLSTRLSNITAPAPSLASNGLASSQKPSVSTMEARRAIPKSNLAQKQATSQNTQQIRAIRGSIDLSDNNLASPGVNKSPLSRQQIKAAMDQKKQNLQTIGSNFQEKSNNNMQPKTQEIPLDLHPEEKRIPPIFIKLDNGQEIKLGELKQIPPKKSQTVSQTQENSRIDALWAKLHNNKNTRFLTDGTTAESTPSEKTKLIRTNISKYKDSVELNNLKMNFKLGGVDENFKKITPKDTKIIELSSKALYEINNGTIEKAESYLERIDNLTKPGLLKQAAIVANDKIVQPLASKINNKVQQLQSKRNSDIKTAKDIGIYLASAINKYAVQKIADKAQEKTTTYKKKLQERTR